MNIIKSKFHALCDQKNIVVETVYLAKRGVTSIEQGYTRSLRVVIVG